MENKQNNKNGKVTNKTNRNSMTNEAYNGMGNCTSAVEKNSTEAGRKAQAKKNNATDCSH